MSTIYAKGKWKIQIKIREIQIKNPGNPNKNLGKPKKIGEIHENQTKKQLISEIQSETQR
jgi:hypothetical protein